MGRLGMMGLLFGLVVVKITGGTPVPRVLCGLGWRFDGICIENDSEYVSSAACAVDGGGVRWVCWAFWADVLDDDCGWGGGA